MKKSLRRLLVIALSAMVALSMGSAVFAYTAQDDNGDRTNQNDVSMHKVYSTAGMLRIMDEGTSVVLNEAGTAVDVTAVTSTSKTWGSVTKIAFAEQTAEAADKDASAAQIVYDNADYSATAVSRTLHFSIPVNEIGKMIPVCRYVAKENGTGEWTNFTEQPYYNVLWTPDLYAQVSQAAEKATDETVKAQLQTAAAEGEKALEIAELTVAKDGVMMNVKNAKATLYKDGSQYRVLLNMGDSTSYTAVYPGYADVAKGDEANAYAIDAETNTVVLTVPAVDQPFVYSFKGSKWFNRTITIDTAAKTFTYSPAEITLDYIDNMTTEDAIAAADVNASVENVNKLIEAIQVQVRTENTDKYCAVAKAYYDALQDKDKAKLDDPDYFGLDTGDASKDDPLNTAPDKEKEILVVSFGTSFNDSRAQDIGGIEKALTEAYPDYAVRRAFTAQIIINHVQARDGVMIDNVDQALAKAAEAGVKELVIQPTHLMHGAEYDELVAAVEAAKANFGSVKIAEPLLGQVGASGDVVNADKKAVAEAAVAEAVAKAGAASIDALAEAKTAVVFMGHGTAHNASVTYEQMQTQMNQLGYKNVFVGTVEGIPASTALPEVKKAIDDAGYTKVILRPLMVVAGDHANNDMAGDWADALINGGEFEVEGADAPVNIGTGYGEGNVTSQIEGLGRIPAVQQLYVAHTDNAINPPAAAQKLKIAKAAKTVKAKKLKKNAQVTSKVKVTGAKTAVTYAKVKKGSDKRLTINKKTGKITVKKGTKKGTYKIKIKVTAKATATYKAASATATIKVKVK